MKETTYVFGKNEFKVTVDTEGELRVISVNGETARFSYRKIQNHTFLIQFGDKKETLYVAGEKGKIHVWAGKRSYIIEEKSEEYSATGAIKKEEGVQYVSSPMPGKVVKVFVRPGDKVKEGQVLIIVESMKMENEFTADFDGIVKEVNASPGDQVDADVPLVVIEAREVHSSC